MTPATLFVWLTAALVLFAPVGATAKSSQAQFAAGPDDSARPARIGRCGDYVAIDGSVKIVRIEQTTASSGQATTGGGPGYAGFEVWYVFTPDQPVSDSATESWIAREHELRLTNSWYPGPAFLEKYGLAPGVTLAATLKVQKSGPCTPFVVELPAVDTTDYFESAR